jgi:predicted DNA-binding transcriptional regulator AlpA
MPKTTLKPAAAAAGTSRRASKKPPARRPVPALAPELADVALIDAPRIAAAACLSLSQWYAMVARGDAPQPVMRSVRCTRWRLSDIRAWLADRAERGCDPQAARAVVMKARNASKAAQARRQARQAGA